VVAQRPAGEVRMDTLGMQLDRTAGRPSGFDYMRLGLSVAIIAFHSVPVSYGPGNGLWTSPIGPLCFAIVPAFFALSGFLVAGSLQRNDLPSFLTLRAIRIFPALCVEVVLSALVLGALFTTLTFSKYLSSPMFHAYFLNIVGDIHYHLPGVFDDLPYPSLVNVQLWTVPFELQCYLGLSLLALARIHKRPVLLMALVTAASLSIFAHGVITHHVYAGYGPPPGHVLILSFLFGVSLYLLRDRIPFSRSGCIIAAIAAYLLLLHGTTIYLAVLPIAYVTVFLGLCDPRRTSIVLGADYSYGMYLYGFPIQQSIAFLLPGTRIWYVNFALGVIVAGCFAAFSWHVIEKRVLARKKSAVTFARRRALSHPALCRLFQWEAAPRAKTTAAQRAETA
jgi:peptidoglycan/LPS O-acetylase OafA/YrhL